MTQPRVRGLALITTLYVVTAVLIAGLTLAAIASFSYSLSKAVGYSAMAFEAANTGVCHCMQNLEVSPAWGASPSTHEGLGRGWTPPGPAPSVSPFTYGNLTPEGQDYYMTFDRTSPWVAQYGLRVSINNLSGTGPVNDTLNGVTVAPNTVHLYVLGLSGQGVLQRRRMVEVVLQFPPVEWAVAASNNIVATASPFAVMGQNGLSPCAAASLPAGIMALHQGGGANSVALAPCSAIYGDVRHRGQTQPCPIPSYSPGCGVNPAPSPWSESLSTPCLKTDVLPDIDIDTYNTYQFACKRINGNATDSDFPLGCYCYKDACCVTHTIPAYLLHGEIYVGGDLTLGDAPIVNYSPGPSGSPVVASSTNAVPVVLQDAKVFIKGNFVERGGMIGNGTIFATGTQVVAAGLDVAEAEALNTKPSGGCGADILWGAGIALFANGTLDLAPVHQVVNGGGPPTDHSTVSYMWGTLYSHNTITVEPGIHMIVGSILSQANGAQAACANVVFNGSTIVVYWPEFSEFGSVYATKNMMGSLMSVPPGKGALMKVIYWADAQ